METLMQGWHNFQVKPVTPETWPDFEALFESRGGPKYCWCMAWRSMEQRSSASNADRKQALYAKLLSGTPIGLMGYADGQPVAWCSVAPRSTFLPLRDDQTDEPDVWSITCFFIQRAHRGKGLSGRMLDAAIEHARLNGAKALEGYPVDPESPSYRFMGFLPLFEQHGFREVARSGTRRHVFRLDYQ